MGDAFDALNNGHAMDFRYEKNPRCPHCGNECDISVNEWWRLYEEGEHEVECPSILCERPFTVSTHVSHSFSTDEQDIEE